MTHRNPRRVDILFERAHQPDPRVRRVSRALADAGYRVRVLAWDRSGNLPDVEDDAGVETGGCICGAMTAGVPCSCSTSPGPCLPTFR